MEPMRNEDAGRQQSEDHIKAALEVALEKHRHIMFKLAFQMAGGNEELAEEIYAQTVFNVYKKVWTELNLKTIESYLRESTINTFKQYFRKKKADDRKHNNRRNEQIKQNTETSIVDPSWPLRKEEYMQIIYEMLKSEPDRYKNCFLRFHFECPQKTLTQICIEEKVAIGSYNSWCAKWFKRMQRKLNGDI